jgi:WD40 repeat protein
MVRTTGRRVGWFGQLYVRSDSDKPRASWQAHDSAITALAVSPDGSLLVSGARDGAVRVWNIPWIRAELRKLGLDWTTTQ